MFIATVILLLIKLTIAARPQFFHELKHRQRHRARTGRCVAALPSVGMSVLCTVNSSSSSFGPAEQKNSVANSVRHTHTSRFVSIRSLARVLKQQSTIQGAPMQYTEVQLRDGSSRSRVYPDGLSACIVVGVIKLHSPANGQPCFRKNSCHKVSDDSMTRIPAVPLSAANRSCCFTALSIAISFTCDQTTKTPIGCCLHFDHQLKKMRVASAPEKQGGSLIQLRCSVGSLITSNM